MGKKQKRNDNALNQSCYLQVLGLGCDTLDTLPSVLLFFDKQRFIFNIGEGFQKFSLEHRIKTAKIDGIFLTRTTTEAAGGLPGLLLTLADKLHGDYDKPDFHRASYGGGGGEPSTSSAAAEGSLSVHGPKGMKAFTNCLRTYVNIRDIKLSVSEIGAEADPGEPDPEVGGVGASTLPEEGGASRPTPETHTLVKNAWVEISSLVIESDGEENGAASIQAEKRQRVDGDAGCSGAVPGGVDGQVQVSVYLIELCDIPGKFLPHKAMELGVPKGPAFGKLCRGESVMSNFGRYVEPSEVMEPATPGPTAIVLDLPTTGHLRGLESTGLVEKLAREREAKEGKKVLVIHLSPNNVVTSEEFRSFVSRWPACTRHIMVHHKGSEKQHIFSSATRLQAELNKMQPEFFPLHQKYENVPDVDESLFAGIGEQVIKGTNLLKYHLRPLSKHGPDDSESVEAESVALVEEQSIEADALRKEEEERKKQNMLTNVIRCHEVQKPLCVSEASPSDLEVTFCGTGAAIPSKYRNLSGIYCNLFEKGGILLDSGEGVCGQLTRRFGSSKVKEVLASLKVVWISHIHADHHSGLPSLLRMRSKVAKSPLVIVGPRQLRRVLSMYSKIEYVPIEFIDCSQTTGGSESGLPRVLADRLEELGISSLKSVEVNHTCYHAYGAVLEGKKGWKLSFSGDTRPCETFIKAAADSTILIHEATFENGLVEEAKSKKHSLTGEAIDSGRKANAYRTILTHFSQRYPKIPVIDKTFTSSTCIAFDLMTFNLCNLEWLPKVVPDVAARFESDPVED